MNNVQGAIERAKNLRDSFKISQAECDTIEMLDIIEHLEERLKTQLEKVKVLSDDAARYQYLKNAKMIQGVGNFHADNVDAVVDGWRGTSLNFHHGINPCANEELKPELMSNVDYLFFEMRKNIEPKIKGGFSNLPSKDR